MKLRSLVQVGIMPLALVLLLLTVTTTILLSLLLRIGDQVKPFISEDESSIYQRQRLVKLLILNKGLYPYV